MTKKSIKTILFLPAMLFANIEAAHAGLVHKLKLYIHNEFETWQFLLIIGLLLFTSLLTYIIITPVVIGKQKLIFLGSFTHQKDSFQSKRKFVSKTGQILSNTKAQGISL